MEDSEEIEGAGFGGDVHFGCGLFSGEEGIVDFSKRRKEKWTRFGI